MLSEAKHLGIRVRPYAVGEILRPWVQSFVKATLPGSAAGNASIEVLAA